MSCGGGMGEMGLTAQGHPSPDYIISLTYDLVNI